MTAENREKVRYAVVGLGYFAQGAILPAFAHAKDSSELTALVSDDPEKLSELGKKYAVSWTGPYERYDELLRSGRVDAVYIALPNHLHREYTERAARAGVHVLCEKPMAVTEEDCEAMIAAARAGGVKLMIAYRLHFEEANLKAVELVRSGRLGEVRHFDSVFTMDVKSGNIRLNDQERLGGGPLYDIGVYCINAARYLFRAEPTEAFAFALNSGDPRFQAVDQGVTAVLRFPGERLATFTCAFGLADVSSYRVVGEKGALRVEPAYEYAEELVHHLTIEDKTKEQRFRRRDQVAPEIGAFSRCVLTGQEPEPSGVEGLADVRVIRAVQRSVRSGRPERIVAVEKDRRPELEQEQRKPAVSKPDLVNAEPPGGK